MTALSFVWVHPYSQNSGCDTYLCNEQHDMYVRFKTSLGYQIFINHAVT